MGRVDGTSDEYKARGGCGKKRETGITDPDWFPFANRLDHSTAPSKLAYTSHMNLCIKSESSFQGIVCYCFTELCNTKENYEALQLAGNDDSKYKVISVKASDWNGRQGVNFQTGSVCQTPSGDRVLCIKKTCCGLKLNFSDPTKNEPVSDCDVDCARIAERCPAATDCKNKYLVEDMKNTDSAMCTPDPDKFPDACNDVKGKKVDLPNKVIPLNETEQGGVKKYGCMGPGGTLILCPKNCCRVTFTQGTKGNMNLITNLEEEEKKVYQTQDSAACADECPPKTGRLSIPLLKNFLCKSTSNKDLECTCNNVPHAMVDPTVGDSYYCNTHNAFRKERLLTECMMRDGTKKPCPSGCCGGSLDSKGDLQGWAEDCPTICPTELGVWFCHSEVDRKTCVCLSKDLNEPCNKKGTDGASIIVQDSIPKEPPETGARCKTEEGYTHCRSGCCGAKFPKNSGQPKDQPSHPQRPQYYCPASCPQWPQHKFKWHCESVKNRTCICRNEDASIPCNGLELHDVTFGPLNETAPAVTANKKCLTSKGGEIECDCCGATFKKDREPEKKDECPSECPTGDDGRWYCHSPEDRTCVCRNTDETACNTKSLDVSTAHFNKSLPGERTSCKTEDGVQQCASSCCGMKVNEQKQIQGWQEQCPDENQCPHDKSWRCTTEAPYSCVCKNTDSTPCNEDDTVVIRNDVEHSYPQCKGPNGNISCQSGCCYADFETTGDRKEYREPCPDTCHPSLSDPRFAWICTSKDDPICICKNTNAEPCNDVSKISDPKKGEDKTVGGGVGYTNPGNSGQKKATCTKPGGGSLECSSGCCQGRLDKTGKLTTAAASCPVHCPSNQLTPEQPWHCDSSTPRNCVCNGKDGDNCNKPGTEGIKTNILKCKVGTKEENCSSGCCGSFFDKNRKYVEGKEEFQCLNICPYMGPENKKWVCLTSDFLFCMCRNSGTEVCNSEDEIQLAEVTYLTPPGSTHFCLVGADRTKTDCHGCCGASIGDDGLLQVADKCPETCPSLPTERKKYHCNEDRTECTCQNQDEEPCNSETAVPVPETEVNIHIPGAIQCQADGKTITCHSGCCGAFFDSDWKRSGFAEDCPVSCPGASVFTTDWQCDNEGSTRKCLCQNKKRDVPCNNRPQITAEAVTFINVPMKDPNEIRFPKKTTPAPSTRPTPRSIDPIPGPKATESPATKKRTEVTPATCKGGNGKCGEKEDEELGTRCKSADGRTMICASGCCDARFNEDGRLVERSSACPIICPSRNPYLPDAKPWVCQSSTNLVCTCNNKLDGKACNEVDKIQPTADVAYTRSGTVASCLITGGRIIYCASGCCGIVFDKDGKFKEYQNMCPTTCPTFDPKKTPFVCDTPAMEKCVCRPRSVHPCNDMPSRPSKTKSSTDLIPERKKEPKIKCKTKDGQVTSCRYGTTCCEARFSEDGTVEEWGGCAVSCGPQGPRKWRCDTKNALNCACLGSTEATCNDVERMELGTEATYEMGDAGGVRCSGTDGSVAICQDGCCSATFSSDGKLKERVDGCPVVCPLAAVPKGEWSCEKKEKDQLKCLCSSAVGKASCNDVDSVPPADLVLTTTQKPMTGDESGATSLLLPLPLLMSALAFLCSRF